MSNKDSFLEESLRRGRDRNRGKNSNMFFFILIAILVSSMILVYVWTFVKTTDANNNYEKLKKREVELSKELNSLRAKEAELSNLSRIEELAIKKLHMTLPTKVEFLHIEYNKDELKVSRQ